MKTIIPISAFVFACLTFVLSSCEQFTHLEVYESPITSMVITLTPDSGQVVILSFIDNDGSGGIPALVNSCTLRENTSYSCNVMLGSRNTQTSAKLEHVIDSTSVTGTPELHQVFFSGDSSLLIDTEYADADLNGFPVGFLSTLSTHETCNGTLSIRILHHPDKSAPKVAEGDASQAGGSTDVEAVFQVIVK